ncbi:MAG: flavodoxin [Candidatus Omnitrophota bacterium]|nr:flavodoxin [Candidatus Omnitrophota bacterium]
MGRAIIVYGSTTGNTEIMSQTVRKILSDSDMDVTEKEVRVVSPEALNGYDVIIFGCSTWGAGELQDDFIPFEEKIRGIRLEGKKAAVFGPGDSMYPQFCRAVDVLEEDLKSCGADIIVDSLKIDGDVITQLNEVEKWATEIVAKI